MIPRFCTLGDYQKKFNIKLADWFFQLYCEDSPEKIQLSGKVSLPLKISDYTKEILESLYLDILSWKPIDDFLFTSS